MNASGRPVFGHDLFYVGTADGGFKFFAVRPDGQGDVTASHVAWKLTKGAPRYSSPILVDDLLFTGTDNGVLSCVDARNGDTVWQERVGGVFTASPIHAAGKVYFFSEDGTAPVIEARRKFTLVAQNKLDAGFMASPAVLGHSLILRTTTHIYRID
jgi:outer membrane protein assembly factor BamB